MARARGVEVKTRGGEGTEWNMLESSSWELAIAKAMSEHVTLPTRPISSVLTSWARKSGEK